MSTTAPKCRAAGMLPWCSPEEWARAYAKAALLLALPPRGPRGSAQNVIRRRRALQVADRARRIVWLEKSARRGNYEQG